MELTHPIELACASDWYIESCGPGLGQKATWCDDEGRCQGKECGEEGGRRKSKPHRKWISMCFHFFWELVGWDLILSFPLTGLSVDDASRWRGGVVFGFCWERERAALRSMCDDLHNDDSGWHQYFFHKYTFIVTQKLSVKPQQRTNRVTDRLFYISTTGLWEITASREADRRPRPTRVLRRAALDRRLVTRD